MAQALVPRIESEEPAGNNILLSYIVVFYGNDLPRAERYTLQLTIAPGETANTIRTNWVAQIQNLAGVQGVSLAANAILLPSFQRG